MDVCIEAMRNALRATARGEVLLPLRQVVLLPDRLGALAAMPAYAGAQGIGVKVITVFPGNRGTAFDSHQGAVLLFDGAQGRLQAVIDAGEVTAIRTAAVSAVATDLLAREDAGDLALLGSGVQARTHLAAMRAVRPIRRVRVWSPTAAHRAAFAAAFRVEAVDTAEAAVRDADLVCTVTASRTPVLEGAWLLPGAHINAVGASLPTARELDTAAVCRARLFVDRRESTLHEAGDFLTAKSEGAIGDDHILGELGDLLLGTAPGRASPDDITLFKSLGLAVEDLAAARVIYDRAQAEGLGTRVPFNGDRHGTD
jgi:ornithine cyclodeaminase